MTDSMLKEASTAQEPLDVGTTVEHPPAELDRDEIARTSPMNVKRSVISLSLYIQRLDDLMIKRTPPPGRVTA